MKMTTWGSGFQENCNALAITRAWYVLRIHSTIKTPHSGTEPVKRPWPSARIARNRWSTLGTGAITFRVILSLTKESSSGSLKIASNHILCLPSPWAVVLRDAPTVQKSHFSPIDLGTAGQPGWHPTWKQKYFKVSCSCMRCTKARIRLQGQQQSDEWNITLKELQKRATKSFLAGYFFVG